MKGQLSGLSMMVSKLDSDGNTGGANLVKALRQIGGGSNGLGVEAPAIQRMTNEQLRTRVIAFANDMRKFESDFELEVGSVEYATANPKHISTVPNREEMHKQFMDQSARVTRLDQNFNLPVSQTYVGLATQYRDELFRRLGPQKPLSEREEFELFWPEPYGTNVSTWSVKATALYLERLALQLPKVR